MSVTERLTYEASGAALLIGAGVIAWTVGSALSPLLPWISTAWLFVVIVLVGLFFG